MQCQGGRSPEDRKIDCVLARALFVPIWGEWDAAFQQLD